MAKMSNAVYKYVEHELYHLDQYKRELNDERERIIEKSSTPNEIRTSTTRKSQTEHKAVTLLTSIYIKKLEKTIEALESALSMLDEIHLAVYTQYYKKHRMDIYLICDDIYISRETFYRKKREIVKLCAIELGLINEM